MGRELGDDETFEAALVADRAMLVRPGSARASAAEPQGVRRKAKAPTSDQLYERIKYEPKRGLDLDYDVRSWHYLYKPYARTSRPSTASPNTRAPSTSSRATRPGAATTTTTARATRPS